MRHSMCDGPRTLAPPTWHVFPGPPITSGTGHFSFIDTTTPLTLMKFYQLMLP